MKKIDILNFITDFRKAPNTIKTYSELVAHLGKENESALSTMLTELKQLRTIRETEVNGERAYQVTSK
jgi:SOS-response transcriptional repressor LexA